MDEYLDFVLDLPETKVVGLFVETARNPAGFSAALAKANDRKVPVIALKVGRTKKSAELAISHSGAMAGDDATYDALFDRYGVHRVTDMDELATAMIMFAELNPIGPGGLVTLHDSGGERQLLVDLADDAGVPLTDLSPATVDKLEKILEPELPAVNPLDAWSRGGETASGIMVDSLSLMMQDPDAAIGGLIHDRAPDGLVYKSYVKRMEKSHETSGKPVALVAARQGTGSDPLVTATTRRGFPVLDGVVPFLHGVRGLMNYRDFLAQPKAGPPTINGEAVGKWPKLLATGIALDEATSLSMLRDFDILVSSCTAVDSADDLTAASAELKYPLVLKTATPGILHKSELRGVILDIGDEQQLSEAYDDLCARIGPEALVAEMSGEGVEMILGARQDPQFGPVILFGFGGVLAEVLQDVAFALPPFDATYVKRRLGELSLRPLLDGVRGKAPAAIDDYCQMAASFSAMVDALREELQEVDINPVIVTDKQCIAVDALVVGRGADRAN